MLNREPSGASVVEPGLPLGDLQAGRTQASQCQSTGPSISVVVPLYNSALIVPDLVCRLERVLQQLTLSYEVILVNDGSRDHTWKVISHLAEQHPWIHGIDLMRNYGQHNALLCGIRHARHEVIVTMDDDLQHPPEVLPMLLTHLTDDVDVVYGSPREEQHGFLRDLASQITKIALQGAMGVDIARRVSALRVFRTVVRDAFAHYSGAFVSIDVLLTWGTTRFSMVPVMHEPRKIGASNYTVGKLMTHAFNMITGFSVLPLQLASWLGFTFTLFGIAVLIYVACRLIILGYSVPGFPFLASTIAIFSGVQLFALGIIGEYLARMHNRSMDKPVYLVRSDSKKRSHATE